MKKLLLIYPKARSELVGFGEAASWGAPPLGLGYIAALTPDDWLVRIADEYVEHIDESEEADLVGITTHTLNATRAYDLAGRFRERNTPVVMGGIHVSMVPEEASNYADSVVIGEAESVWSSVLRDFENGEMRKIYRGERLPLDNSPLPRRDLFSDKYALDVVQTTRGCPFSCEYCTVTAFNGHEYRQRPVGRVLDELETVKRKVFYFTDDNFFGFHKDHVCRAIELCKGIVDRGIRKYWITQTSVNVAENEKALEYAYKSGCRALCVGMESVLPECWKEMRKGINIRAGIDGFRRAVTKIHKHGIAVIVPFIFGSDNDSVLGFRGALAFMDEAGVDVAQIGVVTPFPGTELFKRISGEGRLMHNDFPEDWDKYDTEHVYFKSKTLDPADLIRGVDYLVRKRFGRRAIWLQALKTLISTGSFASAAVSYSMNRDSGYFNASSRDVKFARRSPHERTISS
jgi:radical SAM superfamily enzyme YgiQ (UPF0313 family)